MLNPLSLFKHSVLLSLYFISSWACAQNYYSSSSAALGGAGRAAVEAGDVNYLNPAALVHARGRFIYSTFSKDDLSLGLSEASRSVIVPANLSYLQKKFKDLPGIDASIQEFRLSLAGFAFERFSIGVTGNMNTTKVNGSSYDQTNGNFGIFYTPTEFVGLAAVAYNVFNPNANVPAAFQLRPQAAVGVNGVYRNFLRGRFDVQSASNNNFGKPQYMAGFESLLNDWIVARLGYQNDIMASQELLTMGFAFNGPVFAFNYAHQGNIKGKDFDRHSIDFVISF